MWHLGINLTLYSAMIFPVCYWDAIDYDGFSTGHLAGINISKFC